MTGQINNALFYSPAELDRVAHPTNIEKTSNDITQIIQVTYDKSKYMKQDMYSVTYNPSFFSFFPTKERRETEIKFPSTPHHHNIIQKFINNS